VENINVLNSFIVEFTNYCTQKVSKQCCGSMTFGVDADQDPTIFVIDLQDATKN